MGVWAKHLHWQLHSTTELNKRCGSPECSPLSKKDTLTGVIETQDSVRTLKGYQPPRAIGDIEEEVIILSGRIEGDF